VGKFSQKRDKNRRHFWRGNEESNEDSCKWKAARFAALQIPSFFSNSAEPPLESSAASERWQHPVGSTQARFARQACQTRSIMIRDLDEMLGMEAKHLLALLLCCFRVLRLVCLLKQQEMWQKTIDDPLYAKFHFAAAAQPERPTRSVSTCLLLFSRPFQRHLDDGASGEQVLLQLRKMNCRPKCTPSLVAQISSGCSCLFGPCLPLVCFVPSSELKVRSLANC